MHISQHPFLLCFRPSFEVCTASATSGDVCDTLPNARAKEVHCRFALLRVSSIKAQVVCLSDFNLEICKCYTTQSISSPFRKSIYLLSISSKDSPRSPTLTLVYSRFSKMPDTRLPSLANNSSPELGKDIDTILLLPSSHG